MSEAQGRPKAVGVVSVRDAAPTGRTKHRSLTPADMPRDFSISLDAYRKGGTDAFLVKAPEHAVRQALPGFEPSYVNIVDYIVRITHRIWEEKDIGYIYDTYAHDCMVWDDFGLTSGRDKVVAHTAGTINAFPDIRILADECIWAGSPASAFHSSHRTQIFGTNTGFSQYGPPTGKRVQFWCMANCVMQDNEIFYEHVVYDFVSLISQLGFDVVETARRFAQAAKSELPSDFLSSEPSRSKGQAKPERLPVAADSGDDPEQWVRAVLHNIWNRRDFSLMDKVFAPGVVSQGTAGRVFHGVGQLRSFMLSQLAMFPDLLFSVDDLYWMGNPKDGFLVAIRWSMDGTHRGNGRYGAPTNRETNLWGITHWVIENNVVTKEWSTFNEFGVLMHTNAESICIRMQNRSTFFTAECGAHGEGVRLKPETALCAPNTIIERTGQGGPPPQENHMKHLLGASVSLAVLALSATAVFADCGITTPGSVRILSNDFAALKVVNDAASTCASDTVKVTVNQTTEHKNIQGPALSVNPAEYTVAAVANNSIVPLLNDGLIRPLDDLVAKYGQQLEPNQLIKIDGKVMAIAFMANGQHLFFRKDILEKAGVQPPKTYEDVLAAAKAIKDKGLMPYPLAASVKPGWDLAAEFVNDYLATGGEFFEPGSAKLAINNDNGKKVLELMRAEIAYMSPDYLTFDANEIQKQYEAGNVAIMNEWGSIAGAILDGKDSAAGVVENTVVAGAPTFGGTVPAAALWWDGFTIAKNISDADAEASFQAMMKGISPETIAANPEAATWLVKGYTPGPAAVGVIANAQGGARPYPMTPYMGLLHTALSTELADFVAGKEDADKALADVDAAYSAAAKEGGFL